MPSSSSAAPSFDFSNADSTAVYTEPEDLLALQELVKISYKFIVKKVIPTFKARHIVAYQSYVKEFMRQMQIMTLRTELNFTKIMLHPSLCNTRVELH